MYSVMYILEGGRLCRCFDSMLLEILGPEVASQVRVHICVCMYARICMYNVGMSV